MAITDRSLGRQQFLNYAQRQKAIDKEIAEILRDAAREAGQILARMPGEGIGAQVRAFQYANAISGIEQINDGMWDDIGDTIQGAFRTVTEAATDGTEDLMDFLTSNLSDELADNIVAGARNAAERVEARITNDIDIRETVAKNKALSSGKLNDAINNGLALGKSAREIAQDVMKFMRPDVPGGASFAAMRIGRTELNNAFHTAAINNYKRHPWVSGVKWELSGSHPRPDICSEYAEDDKFGLGAGVFPTMAAPFKPHPNCLCYVTPITPSPQEFQQNLLDGEYDEWLDEQGLPPMSEGSFDAAPKNLGSKITQDQIMAARESGLSWAQIADQYGLGNPGAARRAWAQLTGTPHTTSIIPGKAGRKPGVKKTTTTAKPSTPTPKAKTPSTIKPSEALPGDVVKFRPIGFKNDITMSVNRLDNNGFFVGHRASYKNGQVVTRGEIRAFTPSQSGEIKLLRRFDKPDGIDMSLVQDRLAKHLWQDAIDFRDAQAKIYYLMEAQAKKVGFRYAIDIDGLSNMSVKSINRLGRTMADHFNKFPGTKINQLHINRGFNAYARATRLNNGQRRMELNARYFGRDWKEIDSAKAGGKRRGWSVGGTGEDTIAHELGHLRHYSANDIAGLQLNQELDDFLTQTISPNLPKNWSTAAGSQGAKNRATPIGRAIRSELSEYAGSSRGEMVAEAYDEVWRDGANARPFAKRIVQMVERY